MAWLDLSQPMHAGMPYPQYFPRPEFKRVLELTDHTPRVTQFTLCTHMGTHIDAPSHFLADGRDLDEYPLERFLFRAVVWRVNKGPLEAVTVRDLERLTPKPAPGEAVFIATGWGERWERPDYYDHPYLADEVADWLVEHRISLLGMDVVTPDRPAALRSEDFAFPVHRRLLSADVLILENLSGITPLAGARLEVFAAPLKLRHADGAPARVIARVLA